MRLVPFGEYIPARSLLGWATSVGKAAGEDRQARHPPGGDGAARRRRLRFGPLVCFESAFPDMSRHLASDGAQVLVAQSSTSSFQHSWAPAQHASLARAAGGGDWPADGARHADRRSARSTAPTASAVGPRLGTGAQRAPPSTSVPLADGRSPYVRFGDWVRVRRAAGARGPAALTEGAARGQAGLCSRTAGTTRSHSSWVASASRALSVLPGAYRVEEGQDACSMPRCRATGTQSPRRRTRRLALVVDDLGEIEHLARLVSCPETSRISSVEPLIRFIDADGGEAVAGQLEHHVVQQPVADPGADVDVLDGAGREEAQGVHDVDEVVEDHRARRPRPGRRGSSA